MNFLNKTGLTPSAFTEYDDRRNLIKKPQNDDSKKKNLGMKLIIILF